MSICYNCEMPTDNDPDQHGRYWCNDECYREFMTPTADDIGCDKFHMNNEKEI